MMLKMPVVKVTRLSTHVRVLILQYAAALLSSVKIQKMLVNKHHVKTTRQAVWHFLQRFQRTRLISDIRCSNKRHSIISDFLKQVINMWLSKNNEHTSKFIRDKLLKLFETKVSIGHISHIRRQLGWTVRRINYCLMISHPNRLKRMQWCLAAMTRRETFQNVLFVDETTVEMSSNGKLFFYKPNSDLQHLPAKKQKPKHSYKVHLWGGISYRGRTDCCIFTAIMDSVTYQKILQNNFLPFVEKKFPDGYRLYQISTCTSCCHVKDNDSKHKSKSTVAWMTENNMIQNVMECPASSPDINAIENLWSTLKQHLENTVKPKKRDELVKCIKEFWETVTAQQCSRYIDHVQRVLPVVVLNDGAPSGF